MTTISDALRVCQAKITRIEESYNATASTYTQELRATQQLIYKKRGEIIQSADPKFWSTVFMAHPDLEMLLGPYDGDILADMKDFVVEESIEDGSFKIVISFHGKNDYIADTVVWKRFDQDGMATDRSGVKWKEGHQPELSSDAPAAKHEASKRGRVESFPSFFTFFMEDKPGDVDADIAVCLKSECWEHPFDVLDGDGEEDDEDDEEDDEEGEEAEGGN